MNEPDAPAARCTETLRELQTYLDGELTEPFADLQAGA